MANYLNTVFCSFSRNWGVTILVLLWSVAGYAQGELQHLPLGIMPMQLNSSFAGGDGARLNTAFSYKKSGDLVLGDLPTDFHSMDGFASYDQYIPALKSGIGIAINRGRNTMASRQSAIHPDGMTSLEGLEGEFDHQNLAIAIAPKFRLKRGFIISPSLDFSYGTIKGEMRSKWAGNEMVTEPFDVKSLQSRLGLLISGKNFYFGAATYVFERVYANTTNFISDRGRHQSWLQAAYTFRPHRGSKFSFTPQLAYLIFEEGSFNKDLGSLFHAFNLSFQYHKYLAGINNAGVHLGVETVKFQLIAGTLPWRSKGQNPYRSNGQPGFYHIPVGPFSAANVSFRYNL